MMKLTSSAIFLATIFSASTAMAAEVEIYLQDMLDNTQSGYCIDIAGGKGSAADPADGLQGHTCYSPTGSLEVDQTFDSEQFADGVLYMTNFDVCAQVSDTMSGSAIELAACDGSDSQTFEFSGEGSIVPASATDMCFTVAEDTRSGRSDTNQIKVLSLESCDAGLTAYQTWANRSDLN